jgi:hypothetical protein
MSMRHKDLIRFGMAAAVCCGLLGQARGGAAALSPVPVAFADGEASAETSLPAPGPEERLLVVRLAFNASPTNNVEFALSTMDGEEELVLGWDYGCEWFARGGRFLEGWLTAPAAGGPPSGRRALTLAAVFSRKSGMPVRAALDADGVAVGFTGPGQEALLAWLSALGGHGRPLRVSVTARGCETPGQISLTATFMREGSAVIVR